MNTCEYCGKDGEYADLVQTRYKVGRKSYVQVLVHRSCRRKRRTALFLAVLAAALAAFGVGFYAMGA